MNRSIEHFLQISTASPPHDWLGVPAAHITPQGTLVDFRKSVGGQAPFGSAEPDRTTVQWYGGVVSRNGGTSMTPPYFRSDAFHKSASQFNGSNFYLATLFADDFPMCHAMLKWLRKTWDECGVAPGGVTIDCTPTEDQEKYKDRDVLLFGQAAECQARGQSLRLEAGGTDRQLGVLTGLECFETGGVFFQFTAGQNAKWTGLYDISRYAKICPVTIWLDIPQAKPADMLVLAGGTRPATQRERAIGYESIETIAAQFRKSGLPIPNGDLVTTLAVSDCDLSPSQLTSVFNS